MTRIWILLLCLSVGYGHQNGEGLTLKQLEGALENLKLELKNGDQANSKQ